VTQDKIAEKAHKVINSSLKRKIGQSPSNVIRRKVENYTHLKNEQKAHADKEESQYGREPKYLGICSPS
jgi:hypothetical protein